MSFIPLKVRRMKSLALLWTTAGPDCRSLKLYWVSAKALTLPISHHGSSQLSFLSNLYQALKRSTPSLCAHYTHVHSWISSFWPVACASLQMYHPHLKPGTVWVQLKREFSWELRIYCHVWWASSDFVKWRFSSNYRHFGFLGSTTWTLNRSRVTSSNCHLSGFLLLWCTPWMRMGIRLCDKGGLGQRQVCRCHAANQEVQGRAGWWAD